MPDILSQIGTAIGGQIKSLSGRVSTLEGKSDTYSEPTYIEGRVGQLTIWADSTKEDLLGTKHFVYNSGRLTQVIENDGSQNLVLTKTLTYDAAGNLGSITKDYA
jgi:YD repeat-containing protein